MFGRSYIPDFKQTPEEYLEMIRKKKGVGQYVIVTNDAPYDIYLGKLCKTEHYTMFYDDDIAPEAVRYIYQYHLKKGFSIQEMAGDLKSIPLLHMHFIKIIPTDGNTTFSRPPTEREQQDFGRDPKGSDG